MFARFHCLNSCRSQRREREIERATGRESHRARERESHRARERESHGVLFKCLITLVSAIRLFSKYYQIKAHNLVHLLFVLHEARI